MNHKQTSDQETWDLLFSQSYWWGLNSPLVPEGWGVGETLVSLEMGTMLSCQQPSHSVQTETAYTLYFDSKFRFRLHTLILKLSYKNGQGCGRLGRHPNFHYRLWDMGHEPHWGTEVSENNVKHAKHVRLCHSAEWKEQAAKPSKVGPHLAEKAPSVCTRPVMCTRASTVCLKCTEKTAHIPCARLLLFTLFIF